MKRGKSSRSIASAKCDRKVPCAEVDGGPSQWQLKYGKNKPQQEEHEKDDKSLDQWIASVHENADATASSPRVSFEQFFMPDNELADNDASEVISEMNMILNAIPQSNNTIDDFDEVDYRDRTDLDLNRIDFGNEFSHYLKLPGTENEPSPRIGNGIFREDIALLF